MNTLEILNMNNFIVIFGILIFMMHRTIHLRSGPPGRSGPLPYDVIARSPSLVIARHEVPKQSLKTRLLSSFHSLAMTIESNIATELALQNRRIITMGTKKLCKVLLIAFFTITLSTISYAQENRILMTTDQQYQNSVANADFESWINWTVASTNPPDGWTRVLTPTIAKETTTAKIGFTSLKITGDLGQGISQAVSVEKNTTYVVSFYYKVNTGHSCTFSLTGDSTGAFTLTGAAGLNSTTWTRKSFTVTTNATDTALTLKMVSDAAANIFYLDGVSVTKGTATPAFSRAVITDSGAQTLWGDLTVQGTTNLNGDVNLGDLSTDNITLTGTLKSPTATDVSIQSTTGILKLNKASVDNEFRVFENAATPAAFTSLRHQNLTTSVGNVTINPAGGTTNITGILAVTGALSIAEGAIQDGMVVTADLKDGAVTSVKIADGTIVNADLAAGSFSNITGVGTLGSLNVSGAVNLATTTGNVGIGTTAPGAGLDVQKAITAASGVARGTNMAQTLTAAANSDVLTGLRIAPTFTNGAFTGVKNYGLIVESGNVGIGTTGPATALDVNGTITSTGLTVSSGGTVSLPDGQIDNTELANSSITVTAGTGLITGGTVSLGGTVTVNLGTLTGLTAGADTLAVNYGSSANTAAQGNVTLTGASAGSGLTGGGGTIAVGAGGTFSAINIGSDSTITVSADSIGINLGNANTWTAAQAFNNGASFPGSGIWNTSGSVGIGTASPGAPLDVAKSYTTASAIDYGAIVEPTYNVATVGANKYTALLVKATESNLAGYSSTKLLLDLQAGSTPASKFSVDNVGNITQAAGATINNQTIGATTSLAAVNVSGDMTVGGGYGSTGVTMDSSGNLKLDGNIYIKGVMYRENLTDLQVQNSTITLNASDAPTDADAYIGVMSGGTKLAPTYTGLLKWTALTDTWDISNDVSLATGKAYKVNNVNVLSATTLGSSVVNSSLQTVGTIGTGVWRGTPVEVAYGGTNITSYAIGDLVYASGATTLSKLADVATGSVLVSGGVGAAPSYSSSPTITGTLTAAGLSATRTYTDTSGTVTQGSIQPTFAPTSGTAKLVALDIAPTINQTGTATGDYTALQVNTTQTAATGANKLLADFQVGGVSKAKVDSTGAMTIQGLTIGSTALTSSAIGSEGAKLVGTKTGYTRFTATAPTVQGALEGIDTALGNLTGGSGSFTNLVVSGTSDLQGAISNSVGAVTIADALTQTGGGQVSLSGNVDAAAGVDVTGALNLAGGTTYKVTATGDATLKDVNTASLTSSGNIITTGTGAITAANGLTVSAGGASITGASDVAGALSVTGANNLTVNTNKFTVDGATGNTVVAGTLRSLSSASLIPEYNNATPMPDGADNFGTLSLQYDTAHNYYEWTTSEPTTQDYDIVIRYRLPDGFSSFDATAPIKLWNKVSTVPGATKVDVTMLDTAGAAVTLTGGSTLQNIAWTESTITMTGGTFTAGGYITIIIKMSAAQSKVADVGELTLKGNW